MVSRLALWHSVHMTPLPRVADGRADAPATATPRAHHDVDAADSVSERAANVVDSVEELRTATAGRGFAGAIPSTLAHLETAIQGIATAVDEFRVEALWHQRGVEPAASGERVDAYARDFSVLAGRLYAARDAALTLRERIEPQRDALRSGTAGARHGATPA
jgi:hypothetical protein